MVKLGMVAPIALLTSINMYFSRFLAHMFGLGPWDHVCFNDNPFKQLVRNLRDRVAAMAHNMCDSLSRLSNSWQPYNNLIENDDSHPTKQCIASIFLKIWNYHHVP
jgi:hypothetical protein